MSSRIPRPLDRLAFPRSRRTQLWTCVYCSTFDERPPEAGDGEPGAGTDQRAAD